MSETLLDDQIRESLMDTHNALLQQEKLLGRERLKVCYSLFRERFGPDRIARLDGEELLTMMHAHGNRESLVYWLEFKDDDEFPAAFGSIAGGSALKFGIYRRKETGAWMTGSSNNQVEISLQEAIAIARRHRDQLIAGTDLLEKLPPDGTDEDYRDLQDRMDRIAHDVSSMAWGHKYFSLLYPEKLDDYHAEEFQRFHLIKLLQTPPEGQGRYLAAGRYVTLARELGLPLNQLTTTLNEVNGRPYRYWRIGTRLGEEESIWTLMREGGSVAIGWGTLGNLSDIKRDRESKAKIHGQLQRDYDKESNVASRKAGEICNFVAVISEGDVVLTADGKRILGIGRVTGPYQYEPESKADAPHRRPVKWLSLDEWELPVTEGLRTTVCQVKKYVQNRVH